MKELKLRERMYPASWKQLKKGAQTEKMAHAFLFCGPAFTGKFDMALDLISMLNGIDVELERDKIISNGFPDIVIVQPDKDKKKKEIGVDQVKDAIKKLSYYAYDRKYKCLVVLGADLMNKSAGNSLLKTLEEPTEKTVIILVANREERVLTTIRSRCQRVYFGLKNNNEIKQYIQENDRIDLPEGLLSKVIEISRGKYKLAENLAINPKFLEEKGTSIEKFRKALKGGIAETFEFIEKEAKEDKINSEIIEDWLYFLHSFIKESIKEKRSRQVIKKVFEMEEKLIEVKNKMDNSNASGRILLENYFVQLI